MATAGPLARTPFFFLGRRLYREAELAAYLRREHRRGRPVAEIVDDPYIGRCGGQSVLREVLRRPAVIRALRQDVADAIRQNAPEFRR
jgi:hypothetical protein